MPLHPRAYSLTNSVKKFVIFYKGDPDNVPPFAPISIFENLGRSRSLISSRKNPKKIMGEDTWYALESAKFRYRILNRFCFLKHSENSSKNFGGRPGSPVPCSENPKKILSVQIHCVLKATEFCSRIHIRFRDIWLQTFREFPRSPKLVKLIFPKMREKNRDSGSVFTQVDSFSYD